MISAENYCKFSQKDIFEWYRSYPGSFKPKSGCILANVNSYSSNLTTDNIVRRSLKDVILIEWLPASIDIKSTEIFSPSLKEMYVRMGINIQWKNL